MLYCSNHGISDPYNASFEQGADFLAELFEEQGEKYGNIAAARSALSAILPKREGVSFGKHPLVSKLIKGIFKERPSLPKHTVVYDTEIILRYIDSLPFNDSLMLDMLTMKLCTLLAILSGQRVTVLRTDYMHKSQGKVFFYINAILKTTKPNNHKKTLVFMTYPENKKLCVVQCLEDYLLRTELIKENSCEGNPQLIISHRTPYKPVNPQTIARYVLKFLGMAGIDITVFTAHSIRKASTSKANNMGLSLKDIAKAAGWSNETTFQKFYKQNDNIITLYISEVC